MNEHATPHVSLPDHLFSFICHSFSKTTISCTHEKPGSQAKLELAIALSQNETLVTGKARQDPPRKWGGRRQHRYKRTLRPLLRRRLGSRVSTMTHRCPSCCGCPWGYASSTQRRHESQIRRHNPTWSGKTRRGSPRGFKH